MEVGLVHKINIDDEMQQAYLDYAMSVIVARALPDARDGLKPVHRRILYAMYDMGLRPDSSYKKSARIVGEVLGKYHPHGDMAVYDAMARMAQDFSMRYLLVDGQGNFGSVDGDPPAAMRYTEARLATPSTNMLADIQKNTVNFDDNFDATLKEPSVLPAAFPNLLVNGATGIAVGMATSIPPHNLGEVVDALQYMLEHWEKLEEINVEDLMRFVQGPDFPTGGVIIQEPGEEGLVGAYSTGRGRVTVQARAHLEEMERGRNRIIVTDLPYMTNKASLIERIAELVRDEKLEGIVDLRDESDRQGMRIVIELNKTADPEAVLRNLYKHTPMQGTSSIIMLALVDGEPRVLSLKQALRVYVEHRLEIVRRRSEFDLDKARQRAHILEGLRVALKNLDEVVELIRKAPDVETARVRLMKRFKLSEIQAQAILDMPLRRLAALERKKIEDEYKDVQAQIKELESLLRSPKKMRQVVGDELLAVKEAYGDRRRTQIVHLKAGDPKMSRLTTGDLTPEKTLWISVTQDGLISRSLDEKMPALDGGAVPAWLVQASSRHTLYLVGEQGEAAAVAVHAIPEASAPAGGAPLGKVSALREGQRLAALFSLPPKAERGEEGFVMTATRQGMVKKSALGELPGPSANTFTLVRVNEGDRLGWLRMSSGQNDILLATAGGMAIRFSEEEVRPMGLAAAGVMGIKLQAADEVAGMELLPRPGEVFLMASDGSAKRVPADQFPKQGRYGQGILAWRLAGKARIVGMAVEKSNAKAIVRLESLAPKVIRLNEAPLTSRSAHGKSIAGIKGETVTGLTLPAGEFAEEAEPADKKKAAVGNKPAAMAQKSASGRREVDGEKAASNKTAAASGKPAKIAEAKVKGAGQPSVNEKKGKAAVKATVPEKKAKGNAAVKTSAAAGKKTTTRATRAAAPAPGKKAASKPALSTGVAASAKGKTAATRTAPPEKKPRGKAGEAVQLQLLDTPGKSAPRKTAKTTPAPQVEKSKAKQGAEQAPIAIKKGRAKAAAPEEAPVAPAKKSPAKTPPTPAPQNKPVRKKGQA